ncbi:nuclease-related domain-containing protein [Bacillus sp. V5-8f]|uniref:nuclease-related domain-containing protein n=1 Tax=Bacillus sp. V5-8f TaxID=2053044 RepID=UPI000C75F3A9|nr:nuclease-related domain-containing protein [Bacillus sp. V5-8f]PLT33662.1 NERD nuclease [Bacillus sp. V5-8f]
MFFQLFKKNKTSTNEGTKEVKTSVSSKAQREKVAVRKGELGEYKIDIQLDQLPKEFRHLSDIMVRNPKSVSGYSQIDHIVITPYGIFVIETKNYQGTIYGAKNRKEWSVNGKFKMMNPFMQNHGHIKSLLSLVDGKFSDHFVSIVSFTKRCTFKVDLEMRKISSNELIVYDVELSDFLHRKVSVVKLQNITPLITEQEIESIFAIIQKANITDPELRETHTVAIQNNKEHQHNSNQSSPKCATCNQPVSEKVAAFCLSNKKFQGKVYCFNHQKTI